jgi:hypothetical protein
VIIRERKRAGKDFIKLARRLIAKFKPDLVFADPFLSYVGSDDVSQQKAMTAFLRSLLEPLLQETGVIWFWVHHVSKPPRDDKPATRRGIYAGLGSVELSGWARETISINTVNWDERLFELEFGKRSKRLGLCDETGKPIEKLYIRQSKDAVFWEAVNQAEAQKAAGHAGRSDKAVKQIRTFIERKVNITHAQLSQEAKRIEIGEKTARNIARSFVDDQGDPRIYEYKIRCGDRGVFAFSTVKKTDNPLTFIPKRDRKTKKPKR